LVLSYGQASDVTQQLNGIGYVYLAVAIDVAKATVRCLVTHLHAALVLTYRWQIGDINEQRKRVQCIDVATLASNSATAVHISLADLRDR
jgi:hypothetical protein